MAARDRIGIHGCCGRMGQTIVRAVHADPNLEVGAALEAAGHPRLGEDIGAVCGLSTLGIPVAVELGEPVDCIIDFSVPQASLAIARLCAQRRIPLLVATTGHSAAQSEELIECHHDCALLVASNCSLVVNVLFELVRDAARVLRDHDFDVEIVERHHRFKADAPSGTALQFAQILEETMGLSRRCYGRQGLTGVRPRNELGLHALRVGDNVGEHTIVFSTLGETMELVHKGHGRDSYAKGALAAAKFLITRPPGLYTMRDVLGLGTQDGRDG